MINLLLCLLNTVMNYISRICNEGERHPFNPCSLYQHSSYRTRIIKIFTDIIALRYVILLEKSNPFNPLSMLISKFFDHYFQFILRFYIQG